jgi:hypothetical protein
MTGTPVQSPTDRIKELNDKATQLLLFLSFAMVAAVTLRPDRTDGQDVAVTHAMLPHERNQQMPDSALRFRNKSAIDNSRKPAPINDSLTAVFR